MRDFEQYIHEHFSFKGDSIAMGVAMQNGKPVKSANICIPLKTMNRHGLIAGATGTGKTKTLQLMSELLSNAGVPVLLMDLKGDLSGLGAKGNDNAGIQTRMASMNLTFTPKPYPVEFLSLDEKSKGVSCRATVSEFGPILFSKMLELNDSQEGIVTIVFKYCEDHELLLLDLKDFKRALNFVVTEGKKEVEEQYGHVSKHSVATILRKVIELESQGGDHFFGEPSFDVNDLLTINDEGQGRISIIRLETMQNKSKLFSSFMLNLLAEIYETFPEVGDQPKPKLVVFIDEAHLLFKNSTKTLLDQIETIVKLIRSKGVGIFFSTQSPRDIPNAVLSQLGLKIQHALRAFTAKDRKAIKLVAENFPMSDYYDTTNLLTSMGIGEAIVTTMDEQGRPTPIVDTLLRAPQSRMGPLTDSEITNLLGTSHLLSKYQASIDRESAYELLNQKLKKQSTIKKNEEKTGQKKTKVLRKDENFLEKMSKNTMVRQVGRTVFRELTRGILGVLGGSKKRRR